MVSKQSHIREITFGVLVSAAELYAAFELLCLF